MSQVLNKIDAMTEERGRLETEIEETSAKLAEKKVGKEDSSERAALNKKIGELKLEIDKLQKELTLAQRNDPQRVEEMRKSNLLYKEQVNDKTDELYLARKWVLEKCNMDKETFAKQFGVPVELEHIE